MRPEQKRALERAARKLRVNGWTVTPPAASPEPPPCAVCGHDHSQHFHGADSVNACLVTMCECACYTDPRTVPTPVTVEQAVAALIDDLTNSHHGPNMSETCRRFARQNGGAK
jgi:hypothetical protein